MISTSHPRRTLLRVAAIAAFSFAARVFGADAAPAAPAPAFLPDPPGNDDAGFKAIFDGKSLQGWDGDSKLWRVESGEIVGEVTESSPLKAETFLVWRGGKPGDFELKVQYRVSDLGNSGITYRSSEAGDQKWALDGYQLDIDGRSWGAGFNERVLHKRNADCVRITGQSVGRVIYALPGQITVAGAQQKRQVVGTFGTCATVTQGVTDGWNEAHLIVRGNLMVHLINGQLMSMLLDDDPTRATQGMLGLQLHAGGAMKVEFRNIRIRTITK